jgi:probable HAF family extracellular repeat protein
LNPALGGYSSVANDINNAGQVVGWRLSNGQTHGFILNPGGVVVDLGALGSPSSVSAALSINDSGHVVGYSGSGMLERAFKWTPESGMVDLGTLGGTTARAYAISNAGHVVGSSRTATGLTHAFIWTAATGMVDLETLGGLSSAALGVNDAGEVVGSSEGPSGCCLAFSWTASAGMTEIAGGSAYAINNAGQAVGQIGPPGVWSAPRQDLVLDFPTYGIYALKGLAVWQQIHTLGATELIGNPRIASNAMTSGDLDGNGLDDLVIDFGFPYGIWVWMNHATWTLLHGSTPAWMVTGNLDDDSQHRDEVVLDYPGYGLFRYDNNTNWSLLHGFSAHHLVTANVDGLPGDELIVHFPSEGLWMYRANTWTLLHAGDPISVAAADLDGDGQDEVIASFYANGLWAYRNNTWTLLHPLHAIDLAAGDLDGNGQDDLVVRFDPPFVGLYVYGNDSSWGYLTGSPLDHVVIGDLDGNGQDDLVVDFGGRGVWMYQNNSTWRQLHSLNPDSMTIGRLH